MNLQQLRCVEAVVANQSFHRAAMALSISKPVLSYKIRQLEDELGSSLFTRRRGRVLLTEAGRVLRRHAGSVPEACLRATEEIEVLTARVIGVVRIGIQSTTDPEFLPSALKSYTDRFPGVRFQVSHTSPEKTSMGFENGWFDLVVLDRSTEGRARHHAGVTKTYGVVVRAHEDKPPRPAVAELVAELLTRGAVQSQSRWKWSPADNE